MFKHFKTLHPLWLQLLSLLVLTLGVSGKSLRLNQIQIIGTHNSYHLRPAEEVLHSARGQSLDYGHAPLYDQLDAGVRSFAIDIYNTNGAFPVLHIPEIDDRSSCQTLKECLGEILKWSNSNADHIPLIIFIEVKNLKEPRGELIPMTVDDLETLEDQLWQLIGEGNLITPDEIRGSYSSLEQAILTRGWPFVETLRGRMMLVLNAPSHLQSYYADDSPSLSGRAMFVKVDPGNPQAAVVVTKDPSSKQTADWIDKGYLVRARADIGVKEAVAKDVSKRDAAFSNGCHIITTDFPSITPHPQTGYQVALPNNDPWRPNPMTAQSQESH